MCQGMLHAKFWSPSIYILIYFQLSDSVTHSLSHSLSDRVRCRAVHRARGHLHLYQTAGISMMNSHGYDSIKLFLFSPQNHNIESPAPRSDLFTYLFRLVSHNTQLAYLPIICNCYPSSNINDPMVQKPLNMCF